MSALNPQPARSLPERPDLRHLKDQAKDLLRAGSATSLSDAQRQIARQYGFASWPKLKAHVESLQEVGQLKEAIDANDLARVQALMIRNPALHRAPLGYNKNGPLTWAAECRRTSPTPERLAIARWMLENGSDVHQGGDGPLMRAALSDDRIPMMELLTQFGADVNARWDGHYPITWAPCETLAPVALEWLLDHGADPELFGIEACVQMLIGTYARDGEGKHACLEVFVRQGYPLPDTAPMAIHRGRLDLLATELERDPDMLSRHYTVAEIYPRLEPDAGFHFVLLSGATLLHMAIEYHEAAIAEWLIARGADVNARTTVDAEGFGGWTPLFSTTISPYSTAGEMARLLMRRGSDPSIRASLRFPHGTGDGEATEYRDVTAIEFARQFDPGRWFNEAAVAAIEERD